MIDSIISEVKNKGYCKFSIDPDISNLGIGKKLGKIIEFENNLTIQTLSPRLKELEPNNTYSGNYGLDKFPLHSDMAHWYKPPKYLLLKCIRPANNTYTSILDFEKLLTEINVDYRFAHFIPRKKINFKTNILKIKNGNGICRWDRLFLKPFNASAKELFELIEIELSNRTTYNLQLQKSGDCLIINNWKMLHGRSEINKESLNRLYERIYLSELNNE